MEKFMKKTFEECEMDFVRLSEDIIATSTQPASAVQQPDPWGGEGDMEE